MKFPWNPTKIRRKFHWNLQLPGHHRLPESLDSHTLAVSRLRRVATHSRRKSPRGSAYVGAPGGRMGSQPQAPHNMWQNWRKHGGFHKWKIMVYNMKIPFRWMIWGYAHVRKPPNDEQMVVECQLYHLQLALVMLLSYIIYCHGWYLLSFFSIEHQSHSVSSPYITMFFRETWNQTWLMWNVGKTMP